MIYPTLNNKAEVHEVSPAFKRPVTGHGAMRHRSGARVPGRRSVPVRLRGMIGFPGPRRRRRFKGNALLRCAQLCLHHLVKRWDILDTVCPYTHDTRFRNRLLKSSPFSGAGFRRWFFVPYTSGMKISGANKNVAESDINDEFAEAAAGIIASIVGVVAKGKLKRNKS